MELCSAILGLFSSTLDSLTLTPTLQGKWGLVGFRTCLLNHLKTKINDAVRFLGLY